MATILFAFKHFSQGGGAEKNMIEVASNAAGEHEVLFIISGGYRDPCLEKIGRLLTFPSKGRRLFFLFDILFLISIAWRYKISIIHSHHRYPSFVATWAKLFCSFRLLTTVHNVFPDKGSISAWGDNVIAVSQSVYNWVVNTCRYDPENITLIYNGITPPVSYNSNELESLRGELGIPHEHAVLCTVGRLSEQKNQTLLFDALAKISHRKWSLLLVGKGEEQEQLEEYCQKLHLEENVSFLGHRDDVNKIMQFADIFVLSSLWEGFPYVVVEALANGLPVVSTDVGGIGEAVTEGVTGFLVQSGDAASLSERVEHLMENKKLLEEMKKNCFEIFTKSFTLVKMNHLTNDVYKALLGRN